MTALPGHGLVVAATKSCARGDRPALPPAGSADYAVCMASTAYASLSACALTLAIALAPTEAEACSPDICFDHTWVQSVFPANQISIPTDGVLVLGVSVVGDMAPADLLAGLSVTVTQNSEPIAGALEDSGFPGIVLWRPVDPFVANDPYHASGSFTNPEKAVSEGCAPADVAFDVDLHIADAVSAPLEVPELSAETTFELIESLALPDLVCCDDAYPSELDCGGGTYWEDGQCASARGDGRMGLQLSVSNILPKPTLGLLAMSVTFDGELYFRGFNSIVFSNHTKPVCVVVEQFNLANGDSVQSAELCVGDDLADQLGSRPLDPMLKLAGMCEGPLYTCELAQDAYPNQWDDTQCTPVEPSEETEGSPTTSESDSDSSGSSSDGESSGESGDDAGIDNDPELKGCGCATGTSDPAAMLGLLVLGLFARRRRA